VELALGQKPELFDQSTYPTLFNEQAVQSLRRHGYPWASLLRWVGAEMESLRPTDPFFQEAQHEPPDRLCRRFAALTERAGQLLTELAGSGS
jgi:hypothetical protein